MDKRNKYINYVIDNIFDTQIKFIGDEVIFYFCNINDGFSQIPVSVFFSENSSWNKFDWNDYKEYDDSFEGDFITLLKNYGVDEDEVDIIEDMFHRLIDRIKDKISNNSLNESEDKRNKYINFVIDDLINNTKIEYERGRRRVYIPFLNQSVFHIPFRSTPPPFPPFSKYCKDRYGLTGNDLDYVWEQYVTTIKDKISNKDNINESDDKKERFINYVINDLVDRTKIEYVKEGKVYFPFISGTKHHPFTNLYLSPDFFSESPAAFSDYCYDHFGLTGDESNYVWRQYRSIIKDKITNN